MRRPNLLTLLSIVMLGFAAPALAKSKTEGEFRMIRAGEPLQLRADRAYVLMRIDIDLFKFSANLLRVPDESEIAAYEEARKAAHATAGKKAAPLETFDFDYDGRPNFYALQPGKAIASAGKVNTVVAELSPGDYVVYGLGMGNYLWECLCLGTVGFTAEAGKVTDLGTLLTAKAWAPSPIPELRDEVALGRSAVMDYGLFAVGIRPAAAGAPLPPGLDPALVTQATFRAIGPFVEPNTMLINRLAAMPGVLSYKEGRVVDVKTGTVLD